MKTRYKLFIKLIGVICVLACVISALYIPMSFVANATEVAKIDFKSFSSTSKSAKALKGNGVGRGDDVALNYDYAGDYLWKENTYYADRNNIQDHTAVLCTLENEKIYKISYYIKAQNVNSDFELKFLTGNSGNLWEPGTLTIYDNTKRYFAKNEDLSDWTKIETILTTDIKTAAKVGDDLVLALNVIDKSKSAKVDILVDDVFVEEVTEEIVLLNTGISTNPEIYLFGEVGEEIVFPEIDNSGLSLLGWYTDKEFTQEFTETTFKAGTTVLYAKWGGEIHDFDNYKNSGFLPVSVSVLKESGVGVDSNDALHFDFDGDSVWKKEGDKVTYYYQRNNVIDHRAPIAQLKDKTAYKISYYAKVREANCGFNIRLATGHGSNIFEPGTLVEYSNTVTNFTTESVSEEWVKVESIVITEFKANDNNVGDDLFVIFDVDDKKLETKVDVLLDKLCIVELTGGVICFDTAIPSNSLVYAFGDEGEEIEFPEIENGGLVFAGWYTDKELTQEFTDTTYKKGITELYAKWEGNIVEFDNYTLGASLKPSTGIVKENGIGEKDDYALKFNFVGDKVWEGSTLFWQRSNELDHRAAVITVKDNTTYVVKYKVKVEEANSGFSIRLATGHGSNIFEGGAKTYEETARNFTAEDVGKGYIERSVVLTTKFGDTIGAAPDELFLIFNVLNKAATTKVEAYVDSVTVVEVAANGVLFNSNAAGVDGAYQLGEIGEDIVFPTLTNGQAEFLGWFSDKYCEIPFTETKIKEGFVTAYAKWSTLPITFENYQYLDNGTGRFGVNLSIVNEQGIGYDDDYKLNFNFYGDEIRSYSNTGKPVYWRERIGVGQDNIARLGVLQNKTAYKVSFVYKSNGESNFDGKLVFATGDASNIWLNQSVSAYNYASVVLSKANKNWTKAEVTFVTDFKDANGEMLFLMLSGNNVEVQNGIRLDFDFDNFVIEKLDKPYILFDSQADGYTYFLRGKAGEKITLPEAKPQRTGFDFVGWYTDKECTVAFDQTEFAAGDALILYAGFKKSSYALYDFENYGLTRSSGYLIISDDFEVGEVGVARSGKNAIKIDRTGVSKISCAIIADNGNRLELDQGKKYAVSFWYYVEKKSSNDAIISFRCAGRSNAYQNAVGVSDKVTINVVAETGVWKKRTVIVDASAIKENYFYIIMEKGLDGIFYIDDIEVNTMPDNYNAYTVDNGECDAVPQYVSGAVGTSFASKLPKAPKKANSIFVGYTYIDANGNRDELTTDKMVFTTEKIQIIANFVRLNTVVNFDDGEYKTFISVYNDYTAFDYDYELYDSKKQGNSADGVSSGRYSLHRKGDSMYLESAQILTQNQRLTIGQRYTVKMKVKLGKHLHTDGALKVFSNASAYYSWARTGDAYPVAVIADLKEGEWLEFSYTFVAVEEYLSIQTPGYVELYIDDIVLTRVDEATPISSPKAFTEYVQMKRDENGEIILDDNTIDVSAIIDPNLTASDNNSELTSNKTTLFIITGSGAAVLLAAVIVLIIIGKKKKKRA